MKPYSYFLSLKGLFLKDWWEVTLPKKLMIKSRSFLVKIFVTVTPTSHQSFKIKTLKVNISTREEEGKKSSKSCQCSLRTIPNAKTNRYIWNCTKQKNDFNCFNRLKLTHIITLVLPKGYTNQPQISLKHESLRPTWSNHRVSPWLLKKKKDH